MCDVAEHTHTTRELMWRVGEPCLCAQLGGQFDLFQCGLDGHLPIPKGTPVLYVCRYCRRVYDAQTGKVIGRRFGLAQRWIGAIEIELDHAAGRFYGWYGGPVIVAWNDDGSFAAEIPFPEWSLDANDLRSKARKALRALNSEPGYFARRQAEILKQFHREKDCGR